MNNWVRFWDLKIWWNWYFTLAWITKLHIHTYIGDHASYYICIMQIFQFWLHCMQRYQNSWLMHTKVTKWQQPLYKIHADIIFFPARPNILPRFFSCVSSSITWIFTDWRIDGLTDGSWKRHLALYCSLCLVWISWMVGCTDGVTLSSILLSMPLCVNEWLYLVMYGHV